MTGTRGQQQRAAVTHRGSLAPGSAPPRTPHKLQQGQSISSSGNSLPFPLCPAQAMVVLYRTDSENTHEILSQDNQPGVPKLRLWV